MYGDVGNPNGVEFRIEEPLQKTIDPDVEVNGNYVDRQGRTRSLRDLRNLSGFNSAWSNESHLWTTRTLKDSPEDVSHFKE